MHLFEKTRVQLERTSWQHNHDFRSPSRSRCGRGGSTTGVAASGFAAASAGEAPTAAT